MLPFCSFVWEWRQHFSELWHRCIMKEHKVALKKRNLENKEKQQSHHHLYQMPAVLPSEQCRRTRFNTSFPCTTAQPQKQLLPNDPNQFWDLSVCSNRVSKQVTCIHPFVGSTRKTTKCTNFRPYMWFHIFCKDSCCNLGSQDRMPDTLLS